MLAETADAISYLGRSAPTTLHYADSLVYQHTATRQVRGAFVLCSIGEREYKDFINARNRGSDTRSATNMTVPQFSIPTVDISPYLKDSDSTQAKSVIQQIRGACRTSGFFQITGHGIPRALQAQVFEAARLVFELPVEEKVKLKGSGAGRGYEVLGGQTLEVGKKPDLKEVCMCSILRLDETDESLHRATSSVPTCQLRSRKDHIATSATQTSGPLPPLFQRTNFRNHSSSTKHVLQS